MTAPRPLGYWGKTVDRLIDQQFEEAAGTTGLSRREWQVLNRLAIGAEAAATIEESLAPFAGAGGSIRSVLDALTDAGLVEHQGNEFRLAEAGYARVEEVQGSSVQKIRDRAMQGISAEEYDRLIATLERVAKNLGWEPV
jgi:DNA-binding MarR family transcriptional regulator